MNFLLRSSKLTVLVLTIFLIAGCSHSFQATTVKQTWQSRSDAMDQLIKFRITGNEYDSSDIYKRDGLYYAARQDSNGKYLYSPRESTEHLLDSAVTVSSPTRVYFAEFSAGVPIGKWLYFRPSDKAPYLAEIYQDGLLLKQFEVNREEWIESVNAGSTLYNKRRIEESKKVIQKGE